MTNRVLYSTTWTLISDAGLSGWDDARDPLLLSVHKQIIPLRPALVKVCCAWRFWGHFINIIFVEINRFYHVLGRGHNSLHYLGLWCSSPFGQTNFDYCLNFNFRHNTWIGQKALCLAPGVAQRLDDGIWRLLQLLIVLESLSVTVPVIFSVALMAVCTAIRRSINCVAASFTVGAIGARNAV